MHLTRPYRGPGVWTTDLFECGDDPMSFIEALLCPWCTIAYQYNRLTRGSAGSDCACCLMVCLPDFVCLGMSGACANMSNRSSVQTKYGIARDGDIANFCTSWLCMPCAVSQQYREMCYRNMYPSGVCVSAPIGTPMGFPPLAPSSPQLITGVVNVVTVLPAAPAPPPPQPQPHAQTMVYQQPQQGVAITYHAQPQPQPHEGAVLLYDRHPQPQQVFNQQQPATTQPGIIGAQQAMINLVVGNNSSPPAPQPQPVVYVQQHPLQQQQQQQQVVIQQQPPQQQQQQMYYQQQPQQQQQQYAAPPPQYVAQQQQQHYSPRDVENHPHHVPSSEQEVVFVKEA